MRMGMGAPRFLDGGELLLSRSQLAHQLVAAFEVASTGHEARVEMTRNEVNLFRFRGAHMQTRPRPGSHPNVQGSHPFWPAQGEGRTWRGRIEEAGRVRD